MLYCAKCQEENSLPASALQIFYADCEICGKKCTTCHFKKTDEKAEKQEG